ncbi:MAG: hypothetical protein KKA73_02520 [Chloroflexi bacterium]|nr:hypothetical protein [Chloroflexota bacterium]MBU1746542.1 hypothetical protein [Chloroflexota bacterium]MBU1878980.1 hypothetical protein [Chloroflexota bacterium]
MPAIPAFLLKKLYVKGSLKNTAAGVEFEIKNTLAPGTIVGAAPITIDEVAYPLADTVVISSDVEQVFADVSPDHPLTFGINAVITLRLTGTELAPGSHQISIPVMTKEAGELQIEVKDIL